MNTVISLKQIYTDFGKDKTLELIDTFQCPLNIEIEIFLREKALLYEKYNVSRTFLYIHREHEDTLEILGFFSLTIKEFLFPDEMPNAHKRRILKTGYQMHRQMASILIAQLGKNMNTNLTSMIRRTRTLIFGNAICLKSA